VVEAASRCSAARSCPTIPPRARPASVASVLRHLIPRTACRRWGVARKRALLDKEAAEVSVRDHSLPVIKGVKPAAGAKPLEEIKVIRPTEEEIAKGIPEVKEQFRDTFGI